MRLVLVRFRMTPRYTLGVLSAADYFLYTVEQPWHQNERFISCVPAGAYELVPHTTSRIHEEDGITPLSTWALSNPALNVWAERGQVPEGSQGRYDCLLHPGNTVNDVEGCIAPGLGWNGYAEVLESRSAFERLRNTLGAASAGHTLLVLEPLA